MGREWKGSSSNTHFTISSMSKTRKFTVTEGVMTKDNKYIPYDVTVLNKIVVACVSTTSKALCHCCIYKGFCSMDIGKGI